MNKNSFYALVLMSAIVLGCASSPDLAERLSPSSDAVYSGEDEAVYLARFEALQNTPRNGRGLGGYDPLEPIVGAKNPASLPMAEESALSPDAVSQATAYARDAASSSFLVWRNGALEIEEYFDDFDRSSLIVSRSLAKPVSAILIGRAIALGYIQSLDQPVADFITEWQGDPAREKILIRHLLDMTSGLKPQDWNDDPNDIMNRAYLHPRHDEIIINEYPVVDAPGRVFGYANANAELVAPLIERATGMRYADFMGRALLGPIGAPGGQIWVNREGGTAHAGCCQLLPAQSWLRIGILLLQDGVWNAERLLPEGFVREMRRRTAANEYYGLGLWRAGTYTPWRGYTPPSTRFGQMYHSAPYADKDLFLFDGNGSQVVYMIPSENMVIMRTGALPPGDMVWDNSCLPNLLIRDLNRAAGKTMPEPQPR